jgi:hypothetical protein
MTGPSDGALEDVDGAAESVAVEVLSGGLEIPSLAWPAPRSMPPSPSGPDSALVVKAITPITAALATAPDRA